MKVTLNPPTTPERKIKAVMLLDGRFYLQAADGLMYLKDGRMKRSEAYASLEGVLSEASVSARIYEGDSVTLTL